MKSREEGSWLAVGIGVAFQLDGYEAGLTGLAAVDICSLQVQDAEPKQRGRHGDGDQDGDHRDRDVHSGRDVIGWQLHQSSAGTIADQVRKEVAL